MTQEEKLEEAKRLYGTANADQRYVLESLFPELKESEYERIRKQLLKHLREVASGKSLELSTTDYERWATWVERQGEQKLAWGEEDIEMIGNIRRIIEQYAFSNSAVDVNGELCEKEYIDADNWLKSLKDKVQPQPKQEWSEEDEDRLSDAIFFVREYQIPTRDKKLLEAAKKAEDWLKSLRPQNRWKPSDEQMDVLLSEVSAWAKGCPKQIVLESLYQDLKKLKG